MYIKDKEKRQVLLLELEAQILKKKQIEHTFCFRYPSKKKTAVCFLAVLSWDDYN